MTTVAPTWDALAAPGVADVVDQAVRRIANRFGDKVDRDDLLQDARIIVATDKGVLEAIRHRELGLVQFRLEQQVTHKIRPDVKRANRTVEFIEDSSEEGGEVYAFVPSPPIADDYNREAVEILLPAVWDESMCYGLPKLDTAPDPDMPKGSSNKATANNLPAMIADIKTGWEKTPLSLGERRAILLTYGMGWTQDEIAAHEKVSRRAIGYRLETAVGKIVARLNGGLWYELEQAA